MSWVDEQIKQRNEKDNQTFSDSFIHLMNAVTGKKNATNSFEIMQESFDEILKYYRVNATKKIPANLTSFYEKLDFICANVGLVYREIKLTKDWYKDSIGAILAFSKKDQVPVALIPTWRGYRFLENGKYTYVNRKNQDNFELMGLCFYKSFPNKKLSLFELVKFSFTSVPITSHLVSILMLAAVALIGLLTPQIVYFLYGPVVEYGSINLLVSSIIYMVCISISTLLINTFKKMQTQIINKRMQIAVTSATMLRVFSLQPNFFRKYSSGDLSMRAGYVSSLSLTIVNLIFNTTLGSLFSLIYISSIFEFAPGLVVPSLIVILVTIAFSIFSTFIQMNISKKKMIASGKEASLTYSLVNGISKIRLAGAEKRMFAKWADSYSEMASLSYSPPTYVKYSSIISMIISTIGTFVMYFFAIETQITVADYSAFMSAYGMVFGAFSTFATIAMSIASIKPTYEMAKPILEEIPEKREDKEIVTKLSGNIELSNISFRYSESMPLIFDNLSIKIKAGQYVAIVGKTGCGKSTLVRLLLGFETPQKGSVYYDGKDLNSLNVKSLRRKIGTVMQDGKLFQGDIFSNIAICAPDLTIPEAFEAADIAGIGDDIREMPMGMNTVISESGGGISGGQKQRLLIARAIAPKPKVLIFDEATSALDNITQRKVSESLDKLKCTRIVIAHRLFTIKQCDRIIYLEDGKILEDGTYDELIEKQGKFADLVKRQMLEKN